MCALILGVIAVITITLTVIPQSWACICFHTWDPICGSNNKTYGNICLLKCDHKKNAGLTKISDGICPEEIGAPTLTWQVDPGWNVELGLGNRRGACRCNMSYKPICASDGKMYSNKCNFRCKKKQNPQLRKKSKGACKRQGGKTMAGRPIEPQCECEDGYHPVCGSDGKTYSNECKLRSLQTVYGGECKKASQVSRSACACNRMYRPICGTDGVNYGNKCLYDCERKANPMLQKKNDGECRPCQCSTSSHPVCGSDGVTYLNECELRCAQKSGLQKAYDGKCCTDLWGRRRKKEFCRTFTIRRDYFKKPMGK